MSEAIDDAALRQENVDYLFKIGNLVSSSCAPASRFYISNLEKRLCDFPNLWKNKNRSRISMYCHHCGSIWNSNNCKIRTQSPQKRNCHIKKLLKMERNEDWKLNNKQKMNLRRFYNSTSKIIYRCLTCQKSTCFPGTKSNSSSSHIRTNATSTPIPKLKLNKSDLNAGLFIPSPIVTSMNPRGNLNKLDIPKDNSTEVFESSLNLSDSLNMSNIKGQCTRSSSKHELFGPSFMVSSQLDSKTPSSAKRKKTLLAQILDQEQNKKKKTSLSSFLVSL